MRIRFVFAGLAVVTTLLAQSPVLPPQRPFPEVKHVVVISVDGLRPDCLLLAKTPVLRGFIQEGSYTFWARTTAAAVTLPSHVSMLTGVIPGKHEIEWNNDLPFAKPVYSKVPTLFEMAANIGLSTALVGGKAKLAPLTKPGTLTHVALPARESADNAFVVAETLKIVAKSIPDLLFVHLPDVDAVGHRHGWGSKEQLATIEATDAQVGEVVAAYEAAGARVRTIFIVTADHGGAGRTHGYVGPEDGRSRFIPWIVRGPGVRQGFDLTQFEKLQVDTEDTAATACWLLGMALPVYLDGKVVRGAFLAGSR